MKLSIKRLRQIINEVVKAAVKANIGLSDVEKEIIKNSFQAPIQRLIAEGAIKSDADLAAAHAACSAAAKMAVETLKMIPLSVLKTQAVGDAGIEGLAASPGARPRNRSRR